MAKTSISCIAGVEWLLEFVYPYLAFDNIFSEDSCVSTLGNFFRWRSVYNYLYIDDYLLLCLLYSPNGVLFAFLK